MRRFPSGWVSRSCCWSRRLSSCWYFKAGYFNENSFYEIELARRVERYGHIAQVFSTYESRSALDDEQPFARGINSIQLMHDGERWWVMSIMWDSESEGQPLPEKYLVSRR
jgi:hypothetical protein